MYRSFSGSVLTDLPDSAFQNWDTQSAVRVKPHVYDCMSLKAAKIKEKNWFIPSVLSYLEHPAIKHLGDASHQNMLARNLIMFLEYTTVLEHKIVNRSVETIAHNALPVPIPFSIRMAALKLYADEGYHSVISADVSRQVAKLFEVEVPPATFQRIVRLQNLINELPEAFKNLGWFLTGFVAETVITKEFLHMAKATVVEPVYRMLRDHLEDEWRHSRFFGSMFAYIWKRLGSRERNFCAEILPNIIVESFRLEDGWLERNLVEVGICSSIAEEIGMQRYSKSNLIESARRGSISTLKALAHAGFFRDQSNIDRFRSYGLINERSEIQK